MMIIVNRSAKMTMESGSFVDYVRPDQVHPGSDILPTCWEHVCSVSTVGMLHVFTTL